MVEMADCTVHWRLRTISAWTEILTITQRRRDVLDVEHDDLYILMSLLNKSKFSV